ncbi:MAG: hypothetical protein RL748_1358 [Pseudomonadota bacterium]
MPLLPKLILPLLCCSLLSSAAFALDPACEPILQASEKRISQARWKTETVLRDESKIEAIKVNNTFYSSRDGKWAKVAANLDEQESKFVAQLRSGAIVISNCKAEEDEKQDGVDVSVISMHLKAPGDGGAALDAKLYIGKQDGLPYLQTSSNTKTTYRYKNVFAPRLSKRLD